MGRAVPEKAGTSRKQFMLLEGSPILLHTIRKFALTPAVSEIVVALRPDDIEWVRELLRAENFGELVRLVEGGDRILATYPADLSASAVKTLNRLGLCSNEMADPLKKLAAQKRPLSEFFQVSVYDVDRALKGVEASPEDRIGFKSSLARAGLMTRD